MERVPSGLSARFSGGWSRQQAVRIDRRHLSGERAEVLFPHRSSCDHPAPLPVAILENHRKTQLFEVATRRHHGEIRNFPWTTHRRFRIRWAANPFSNRDTIAGTGFFRRPPGVAESNCRPVLRPAQYHAQHVRNVDQRPNATGAGDPCRLWSSDRSTHIQACRWMTPGKSHRKCSTFCRASCCRSPATATNRERLESKRRPPWSE